jgi:hypothetical protein
MTTPIPITAASGSVCCLQLVVHDIAESGDKSSPLIAIFEPMWWRDTLSLSTYHKDLSHMRKKKSCNVGSVFQVALEINFEMSTTSG